MTTPAFYKGQCPKHKEQWSATEQGNHCSKCKIENLSKQADFRDQAILATLPVLLQDPYYLDGHDTYDFLAECAIEIADALIKARN